MSSQIINNNPAQFDVSMTCHMNYAQICDRVGSYWLQYNLKEYSYKSSNGPLSSGHATSNKVIIMPKRRRHTVWRNYDVIFASCVCWVVLARKSLLYNYLQLLNILNKMQPYFQMHFKAEYFVHNSTAFLGIQTKVVYTARFAWAPAADFWLHGGRDKMSFWTVIFKYIFLDIVIIKFHWSVFAKAQPTIRLLALK